MNFQIMADHREGDILLCVYRGGPPAAIVHINCVIFPLVPFLMLRTSGVISLLLRKSFPFCYMGQFHLPNGLLWISNGDTVVFVLSEEVNHFIFVCNMIVAYQEFHQCRRYLS